MLEPKSAIFLISSFPLPRTTHFFFGAVDILDPALLRPGRLDRKIEIPLPNETSRLDILKIHSAPITKRGEIDFESVVKVSEISVVHTCVRCGLELTCAL